MGRIRTLKPDFFRSRSLAKVSIPARLTFQGLWCEADDHGHGIADPRLLKGALWALDDEVTADHVLIHLEELAGTGHITLYEVDGDAYYEIVEWEKHQAAAYRRGDPLHPSPPAGTPDGDDPHDPACKKVQDAHEEMRMRAGKEQGREGIGKEGSAPLALVPVVVADDFEPWWDTYPKRNGKRVGRSVCEGLWAKLAPDDRTAAAVGARHYRAACDAGLTLAKDPERFLKHRVWLDWQEPAVPEQRGKAARNIAALDEFLAGVR